MRVEFVNAHVPTRLRNYTPPGTSGGHLVHFWKSAMTSRQKLQSIDKDVFKFLRWYITHDKSRLRKACRAGGVNEVIQETCVAICKIHSDFSCEWTTAGSRQIDWTICKLLAAKRAKKRKAKTISIGIEIEDKSQAMPILKLEHDELKDAVDMQIGKLPSRMAEIVRMSLDGLTFREIAEHFGFSYTRALQLYHKAIRKLSELNEAKQLVSFID